MAGQFGGCRFVFVASTQLSNGVVLVFDASRLAFNASALKNTTSRAV